MTPEAFRRLALALEGAVEAPHFARTSFRVGGRIFATMTRDGTEAMVPVLPVERCLALLASDPARFLDHGAWTRRLGSLGLRLPAVDAALVRPLLVEAHARVATGRRRVSGPPRRAGGRAGTRRPRG